MKKIAVYPDGAVGLIDDESNNQVFISGKLPERYIEATEDNINKYFPKYKIKGNIKI